MIRTLAMDPDSPGGAGRGGPGGHTSYAQAARSCSASSSGCNQDCLVNVNIRSVFRPECLAMLFG